MNTLTHSFAYTGNGNLSLDDAIAADKLAATEQEAILGVLADAGDTIPVYYCKLNTLDRAELYDRIQRTGWELKNTRIWNLILESYE